MSQSWLFKSEPFKWSWDMQKAKAEAGEETFMKLRITGDRNLESAYDLLNQYLVKPVQRIPGVARVDLQGIEPLEISIKLDNERMKRYNIGFRELQSKINDVKILISI